MGILLLLKLKVSMIKMIPHSTSENVSLIATEQPTKRKENLESFGEKLPLLMETTALFAQIQEKSSSKSHGRSNPRDALPKSCLNFIVLKEANANTNAFDYNILHS